MGEFLFSLLNRRDAEIDAELPSALRLIGAQLNFEARFEDVLENAGRGETPFHEEMQRVCAEIKAGAGVPSALAGMAGRTRSLAVKRSVTALAQCYSHGEKGERLKRLADEFSRAQRALLKEYAAKASMLGLAFISAACILPSLFLALIVAGSSVMQEVVSAEGIWLAFALVLPAVLALITIFLWASTPVFTRRRGAGFLTQGELRAVETFLEKKGFKVRIGALALPSFIASGLAGAILLAITEESLQMCVVCSVVFLSPLIAYSILSFLAERKARNAESFLPDALLHASSVCEGMGFEEMIKSIARAGYGELSSEFRLAEKKLELGAGFEEALMGMGKRLNSALVERSLALLSSAYKTGADLGEAIRETAEDAVELFSAEKEKAATLAVQKYTLFAGVLLVPWILGFITRAVSHLDFSSMAELGVKTGGSGALEVGKNAAGIYLLMFACFSAVFIAIQEGEPRKAVVYALAFVPVVLVVFSFAAGSG